MNNRSLIQKLRIILRLSITKVSTDLSISETKINSVEQLQLQPPVRLLNYYSEKISVSPKYVKMLFYNKNNYLSKLIIKLIHYYFDLIISLRKANEKKN